LPAHGSLSALAGRPPEASRIAHTKTPAANSE
jgi:hypothetical protein